MQLDILNIKGQATGRTIELPNDIFGIEPNDHVIYLAVKAYQNAQRQGTSKTKNRKEVKGASRKLHKQKGTGGSRKGNIRNPLYKGGGSIFGPRPRTYEVKMNRKEKDLAKMSALAYKAKDNNIFILEDLTMDCPKTSAIAEMIKALKAESKKALFLMPEYDENVYLSTRNIPNILGSVVNDMNTYDILNANILIMTEGAAKLFSETAEEVEA